MKELKIGERAIITLEVVAQDSCIGCCFDDWGTYLKPTVNWNNWRFQCCPKDRSDGKDVIFKLVNV